ncbi:hypothetical protein MPER_02343 [Moniliophthora perniciosa FA553]|nr:hypothetical protein MPER_02343 [Moniliophthora perniciosa FA553]
MSETRQLGDLATQSLIRRQRDLKKQRIFLPYQPGTVNLTCSTHHQNAISKNKRCLFAYHSHRVDRLRDMYWSVGGALPHILSTQDIRSKLSPHEVDYLRQYNNSVMEFRSEFSHELDVTASITNPPKDLHVLVHVVKDCGVIQTELGSIDFQKGQRFMVRRADIEHLIVQGYLEEVA